MHVASSKSFAKILWVGAFLDTFSQRMLPRANMLATRISPRSIALFYALAALVILTGCTPPGPRALLDGEASLRKGKPAEAIPQLKRATDLLPADPRAWNFLGLAYHRAGQPQLAAQAYRQALTRDHSNVVAVAHFNLGCLMLEQNAAAEAAEALRSYTLKTNSAAGWRKLGSAQLRLRQYAEAERSFEAARRLEPNSAEALNGIGLAKAYRGQRDAAQYFAAALQKDPKFAPALLNSAVLAHQNPASKITALQKYRDYLAVRGGGEQADSVKTLVRKLEAELAPASIPPAVAKVVEKPVLTATSPVATVTQAPPAVALANRTAPVVLTQTSASVVAVKSNPPALSVKTNPAIVASKPVANTPSPQKPIAITPVPEVPVTIVSVTDQPTKVAMADLVEARGEPATAAATPVRQPETLADIPPELNSAPAPVAERKPGLLSRLNPFGGRSNRKDVPRNVVINPVEPGIPDASALNLSGRPSFPRYRYTSPRLPAAGNRASADRLLREALEAHRAGRTKEAASVYASALAADPSYFEAQYNSALLAFQSGELERALNGWEMALALQPDSIAARYSFALTLKQAGYAEDAALELEKIVEAKPDDARSHLALGNLYAQQLLDTGNARAHYKRFLELDPRSSQAASVRFWLAANP